MRLLLLTCLLLFHYFQGVGQVVDYWHVTNSTDIYGLGVDDYDNAFTCLEYSGTDRHAIVTKNDDTLKTATAGNWLLGLVYNIDNQIQIEEAFYFYHPMPFPFYSPKNAIISVDSHFYFVWPTRLYDSTIQMFGQTINFGNAITDPSLLIVKTDKKLRVISSKKYLSNIEFSFREPLESNGKDGIRILWTDENASSPKQIGGINITGDPNYSYTHNVLEIDSNLDLVSNRIYAKYESKPFTHSFGRSDKYSYFDNPLHLYNPNTDKIGDYLNLYELNYITTTRGVKTISRHETNLNAIASANFNEKLIFIAHNLYNDSAIYFDNYRFSRSKKSRELSSFYLCELDTSGNFRILDSIIGVSDNEAVKIKVFENQLWLKLYVNEQTEIPSWTAFSPPEKNGAAFLSYNSDLQFLKGLMGANGDAVSKNQEHFVVKNGYLHDIQEYSRSTILNGDTLNSSSLTLYTKTQIPSAPIFKPDFYLDSINCNSYKLHFKSSDAEHYTVFASSKANPVLNINFQSFNWSNDYLKAPKLQEGVRILYQGTDTSLLVKNLLSNRSYHFIIVPGNGPSGNSIYNLDSANVLELQIQRTDYQDSIRITPSQDSIVCDYDSLYLAGRSPFTYTWMDGKTDTSRLLVASNEFSIRSIAPNTCWLSSDTVAFTIDPTPEKPILEIVEEKPYCEGDTLTLAASNLSGANWGNGQNASWIYIDKSGWYSAANVSSAGCFSSDSIKIELSPYPSFTFFEDSIISYGGELELDYQSNADSLNWYYLSDTLKTVQNLIPNGNNTLRVSAYSQGKCRIMDSILIKDYPLVSQAFPNAFSPNGDGVNDVWQFLHPDTSGVLTIIDRWGAVVHRGNNYWDGKKHNKRLVTGVYFYRYDLDNRTERGSIHLIR